MADKNDRSQKGTQKEWLSASTITSHLSEVKSIWSQATAGVTGLAGLGSFKVTTPKAPAVPVDREALSVERLHIWLKSAASPRLRRKPGKAWRPVVGLLTGMRLARDRFSAADGFCNRGWQRGYRLAQALDDQREHSPAPSQGQDVETHRRFAPSRHGIVLPQTAGPRNRCWRRRLA